jgi:hypothetical protein
VIFSPGIDSKVFGGNNFTLRLTASCWLMEEKPGNWWCGEQLVLLRKKS